MKKKKSTDKQLVWSVEWDSGGPGGGGVESVYLSRGKYHHTDSSSGDRFRASELRTLLQKCGLNQVNGATVSIDSPVLSAKEIVSLLEVRISRRVGVRINDEEWVCVAPGVLRREGEEPPTQDDPAQQRLPFEDDGEFDGEDANAMFSCPFCGSVYDDCPHFLGSRDLNFCYDFCVDDTGLLADLGGLFGELGEAVGAFLKSGKKKPRIAAVKPRRLRGLVQAVSHGEENHGFTEYVARVVKDTKVPTAAESHEQNSSPGFCSTVTMFWSEKPSEALAGMRTRLIHDITRLRRQSGL